MRKIITLAIIIILTMVSAAQAEDSRQYVNFNLGINSLSDATLSEETGSVEMASDTGLAMTAALGLKFTEARAELEFGYRNNDIESFSAFNTTLKASGDVTSRSMMVNLYHDFSGAESIIPFIGAGLGLAKIEINDASVAGIALDDVDDTVFTWQLIAGLGFKVEENTFLDFSYHFTNTSDPEFEGTKGEYQAHSLMAGIRIIF